VHGKFSEIIIKGGGAPDHVRVQLEMSASRAAERCEWYGSSQAYRQLADAYFALANFYETSDVALAWKFKLKTAEAFRSAEQLEEETERPSREDCG
jgi:hypothetical protein